MLEMLYPTLLTRKAALLAVFLSLSLPLALADAAAQAPAAAPAAAAPAAAAPAAAAPPPPAAPAAPPLACLGVGAAAIPAAGPGPDPSSQGSDSLAMDRRDYIFPMGIDYDDLHRRQDLSQDSGVSMTGGPVTVPPNTTYCGYLQGLGMQTDLVTLVPGIFQLTWQNVTGDGRRCPFLRLFPFIFLSIFVSSSKVFSGSLFPVRARNHGAD